MAKTTKPTSRRAFKSKKHDLQEDPLALSLTRSWADYNDENTLMNNPTCPKWRQRLIYTILKWAERPDSLEIRQFTNTYKVNYNRLFEWEARYEDVKQALAEMRLMIASNRRIGSINRQFDGKWAHNDLYLYDPITKEVDKYQRDNKLAEMISTSGIVYGVPNTQPKVLTDEEFKEEVNAIV